jgi:hypothetical protein
VVSMSVSWRVLGTGDGRGDEKLTSSTTAVFSVLQEPGAVQTCIGMEGCFSAVRVPICWPSTAPASERVVTARYMVNVAGEVMLPLCEVAGSSSSL